MVAVVAASVVAESEVVVAVLPFVSEAVEVGWLLLLVVVLVGDVVGSLLPCVVVVSAVVVGVVDVGVVVVASVVGVVVVAAVVVGSTALLIDVLLDVVLADDDDAEVVSPCLATISFLALPMNPKSKTLA